jgi:hypothetical protein
MFFTAVHHTVVTSERFSFSNNERISPDSLVSSENGPAVSLSETKKTITQEQG